jgi:hypothetical protein
MQFSPAVEINVYKYVWNREKENSENTNVLAVDIFNKASAIVCK